MKIKDEQENYKERIKNVFQKAYEKESNSFFGFFIKNYRVTYLIIVALIFAGVWSLMSLPVESEPEVEVPYAVVTTVYQGGSPKDVEELVTNKIENKIKDVDNLKEYNSSSSEGVSSIFVEFKLDAVLQDALDDLRKAVDEAGPNLPEEAEKPVVNDINFNDMAIATYSLVGDYNDVELKNFADILQEEFEKIKGVSEAKIRGGLEREFQVVVDQTKLVNYNISLSQIVNAIQYTNFSLPAGNIEIDQNKYAVRVDGKFKDAQELNGIVISTYNGAPIHVRDIASVVDGFKEKDTESRIGLQENGAKNAISLQIHIDTGGNVLEIAEKSDEVVASAHDQELIPQDVEILKSNDNAKWIKRDVKTLGTSALQTMILITFILWLVLSARGALITALSVPMAFLMSFMFLEFQDMTLNSIVLFALVLSLGLMVDNAIVVMEGISDYIIKHKKKPLEAAIISVWNFKWPIISGTLTTVCAFLPMMFVLSGVMGEYLGILPKTLTVTLLSSLFVALVIIPTLAAKFIKVKDDGNGGHRSERRHKIIEKYLNKLKIRYENLLRKILPYKNKRRRFLLIAWILFFITVSTPFWGLMKLEMFPKIDFDYFNINIELPAGSVLDQTDEMTKKVEKIVVSKVPEMESYVTTIGASASMGAGALLGGGEERENQASVVVNLKPEDQRERESFDIAEDLRKDLINLSGAEVSVEELQAGPPSGSPVEVRVIGDNFDEATKIAKNIENYFSEITGIVNIDNSLDEANAEFVFEIDKQKANYYGLNIASIASTLRNAIYGTKASTVNLEGDDIDIMVKYDNKEFDDVNDLKNILLFTSSGDNIPLKQVADLKLGPSFTSITHQNGERVISVTGNAEKGINVNDVMAGFNDYKKELNLPEGVKIETGGEMEDLMQSFSELFVSLAVAIILIAFILVLQFNSFRQPFIILFSFPLSLIGVMIGLNLLRQPFSLTAFIGVVSLAGIVVNDSIVLVDRINKNIANGMDFMEGVIDGGRARMQPIFVTSITTIMGIFPLLFADAMWMGLSLSVIFGLLFSTALTLFVVPILYTSITKKQ